MDQLRADPAVEEVLLINRLEDEDGVLKMVVMKLRLTLSHNFPCILAINFAACHWCRLFIQ